MLGTVAFVMASAFGTSVGAQGTPAKIDSLMSQYAMPDGPGAALLVMHDGRIVVEKGYGLADVEHRTRVTAQSNFRLASLSKQFTATAIMMLVAEKKIRYDDDITTLLPELPRYAHGVTVRQLLNHTGGLPDYEEFVPDSQTVQVHDHDVPRLIARASARKFVAGTRYGYSNTGYVLLGLIVERVSKHRFADFLRDRIFMPLGMTNTVALEEGRNAVVSRVYGHTVDSSGVIHRTDQSSTSATIGDGGIYTSVADLAKWDRALTRHTLVSAAAQRLAWTAPLLPAGEKTEYGFGWFVDRDHGALRVWHHGESRGFTNGIVRYPERRITVVVLTNRTGGTPWETGQRIAQLYLGDAIDERSAQWRP